MTETAKAAAQFIASKNSGTKPNDALRSGFRTGTKLIGLLGPKLRGHVLASFGALQCVIKSEDNMNAPLAYSIAEACAAARTSRTSIYQAIKSGELIARKRGRRTVILFDDLRQWLNGLPAVTQKARP